MESIERMENPDEMWGNTFIPIDVCLGEVQRSMSLSSIPSDIPPELVPPSPEPICDTILSINELEMYKTEAILSRDRLVSIINDISAYRVLNHQYLPITRAFIREIEARDFADIERYKSLPKSFAFVMALHNKECRKMADDEILSNFFGPDWAAWAEAPESVPDLPEERREQIYANYEYMAYVVLNVRDELAFSIQHINNSSH